MFVSRGESPKTPFFGEYVRTVPWAIFGVNRPEKTVRDSSFRRRESHDRSPRGVGQTARRGVGMSGSCSGEVAGMVSTKKEMFCSSGLSSPYSGGDGRSRKIGVPIGL